MLTIPTKVPENGFYYHYKHNPEGVINDYVYEVVGIGHHTEDDCRPEDTLMVVYRPIYESTVYTAGKLFDLWPLEIWMEDVTKDGKTFPRYQKITDPNTIQELKLIRDKMYNS
ncbi:MAG: hypothetical protein JWP09_912 [Candidatus Taylorbacteria bacterium]|nr:hypothetical protein [Candidatus Taylorbacteria bacterium]